MAFFLGISISLAMFALSACDLITGKTTGGSFPFVWPASTRRDNPTHFWITVAWRALVALTVAVLAIRLTLPKLP